MNFHLDIVHKVDEEGVVRGIFKRQLSFLEHINRKGNLEHIVLTGKIEGKRARGRQRKTFLECLRKRSGGRYDSNNIILRASLDRTEWRIMIAQVSGHGT